MNSNMTLRLKRLRDTPRVRALLQETRLHPQQLITPLFINEALTEKVAIQAMPGQYQLSLADLPQEIDSIVQLGLPAVILFGLPKEKDARGSYSTHKEGVIQQAIRSIRKRNKDILIIADACFCEYTDHGHCGLLNGQSIDNDKTLAALAQQAVSLAEAGADWIAPSGMVDGMVFAIRSALDKAGFTQTAILSYAIKYASSLYGPFREAADGAPQFGDRQSYQLNPANVNEARREAGLDVAEGADMLMVKPASFYLDIIHQVKQDFPQVPLCAYQVSGEYAMIKHAAKCGLLEEEHTILESLLSIKRAGADFMISYFAKDIARILSPTQAI